MGYPDLENAFWNPEDSSLVIPYTDNIKITDQQSNTTGVFAQYEYNWNRFQLSAGARFDNYNIIDYAGHQPEKKGNVLSPRLTMRYDIREFLQSRFSYSQGYRAPQIFDEDLHIETSGSRQVIHVNDPALKQETSHSFMASLDFNKKIRKSSVGFLVEGFYTRLNDAFVNEIGTPDENGTVVYLRTNADGGAVVSGINLELNWIPSSNLSLRSGFTIQSNKYEEAQEFEEKSFFRTPNAYGYMAFDWIAIENFGVSTSATYTGKMLIPYFGPGSHDLAVGELRESNPFFDMGIKLRYNFQINGTTLQLFSGMKNIFNSYQDDFDRGIDRDPGYVYGPLQPRTIYFGLKLGNNII